MPSDAKKKQQQKKREAAKARQSGKKPQSNNQTRTAEDGKEQSPALGDLQNGTNGTAISVEGETEKRAVAFCRLHFARYEPLICLPRMFERSEF